MEQAPPGSSCKTGLTQDLPQGGEDGASCTGRAQHSPPYTGSDHLQASRSFLKETELAGLLIQTGSDKVVQTGHRPQTDQPAGLT